MSDAVARLILGSTLMCALVACTSGGGGSGPVFESVGMSERECDAAPAEAGKQCLRVTAVAVGQGTGEGRCLLYASGKDENLFVAADSGIVEIRAGVDFEWDVVVEVPSAEEFDGWNPQCSPMMEG